eukprot:Hpha_TRINITY_DN19676_c0_g1::TRINITY_DN19676_c0_g1_i1::g.186118::m.186118/K10865/MRE11; double-strand break repair protein MRE11
MAVVPAPEGDQSSVNTFRILVATDNHLGAHERETTRRDDPFVTFEEILQKAQALDVDLVLLGGDLFDENKPSQATLHRTITMLRRYCMGGKDIHFTMESDPASVFSNGGFPVANFQDPNLNVSLPVFAIHGNHDDPAGERMLSPLDLLSAAGLVNYIGKQTAADDITLSPVLLTKGTTKLALYGLGHVRDERLNRSFEHGKVRFLRPAETPEEYFSLMAIHQNRGTRGVGRKNGIPEEALDAGVLDLVVWGHEHEQKVHGERAAGDGYEIIQPGSSIITGPKSDDDRNRKMVCLLEVCGTAYRCTPLPLQSVRPVEYAEIHLQQEAELRRTTEEVTEFLAERVEELIFKAKQQLSEIPDKWLQMNPCLKVPLVRMRVEYGPDHPIISPVVFGGRFANRVANPRHILLNHKRKPVTGPVGVEIHRRPGDPKLPDQQGQPEAWQGMDLGARIAESAERFLKEDRRPLGLLSGCGLTQAMREFVDKGEPLAISRHVEQYLERAQRTMWREAKAYRTGARMEVQEPAIAGWAANIRDTAEAEFRSRIGDDAPTHQQPQPAAARPLALPAPSESDAGGDMPPAPPQILPPPIRDDALLLLDEPQDTNPGAGSQSQVPGQRGGRGRGRGSGAR